MEPLTMAAIGATALGAVNSLVDMFSGTPELPEPTQSKEALALLEAQLAQAKSGQGLPQQIISGAERRLSTQASQIVAEGLSMGRQTSVLSSPILFDVLAEKALAKSAEFRQTGLERIEGFDMEAYLKDLARQTAITGQIAGVAANIDQSNIAAAQYKEQMRQVSDANFAKFIGTSVQGLAMMAAATGSPAAAASASAAVPSSGSATTPELTASSTSLPSTPLSFNVSVPYAQNLPTSFEQSVEDYFKILNQDDPQELYNVSNFAIAGDVV